MGPQGEAVFKKATSVGRLSSQKVKREKEKRLANEGGFPCGEGSPKERETYGSAGREVRFKDGRSEKALGRG